MLLLAVPFGLAIGLIVGAVGGGGAILALPVLVYVLGEGVGPASTASLIVIAVAAGGRRRSARPRRARVLAPGAPLLSARRRRVAARQRSPTRQSAASLLILAFVPVMLLAAGATWQRSGADRAGEDGRCPEARAGVVVLAGLAVGAMTGFFGVGGGFMIVPVLTLGLGLAFRRAVATSLVIITITGLAALASHLVAGATPHLGVTASLAASTALGALAGTAVAGRLPQQALARGFAVIVALVAVALLADVLLLGGPPTS